MPNRDLVVALRIGAKDEGARALMSKLRQDVGGVSSELKELARTAVATFGVAFTARAFVEANASVQSLRMSFEQVAGSSQAAAGEIAFVRAEADRLGLVVKNAADSYLGLTASAKGTNLEGQATRDIWSAVAEAMARLGKSDADTQGALLAISQMMSKGTVASEELRGQLAERLPGAFQIAARAMNVTTAELSKMLESGQVIADDFLPKFAAELNKSFGGGGQIDTYNANLNRLKNSLTDAFVKIGSGGTFDALTNGIETLAENFDTISAAALTAGGVMASVWAGKAVGSLTAYGLELRKTAIAQAALLASSQAHAQQQLISAEAVLVNAQRQAALLTGMQRLTFAQTTLIPAMQKYTAAQGAVAVAGVQAGLAQRGLAAAVGFLGGPVGAITTLLTLGTVAWLTWGDKAEDAIDKANRKSGELKDRVKEIQERMAKESAFGAGDVGTLREGLALAEKELALMVKGVSVTETAKKAIEDKRTAINKLKDDIAALGKATEASGNTQIAVTKEVLKNQKSAVKEQIQDAERLRDALVRAYEDAGTRQQDHLAKAANLRAEANKKPKDDSPQGQFDAEFDLTFASGELSRLRWDNAPLAKIEAQAKVVRELASAVNDATKKSDAYTLANESEAAAHENAAKVEGETRDGLAEQMRKNEENSKGLEARLQTIQQALDGMKDKKLSVSVDQEALTAAVNGVDALKKKLDELPETKTVSIQATTSASAPAVPGKAAGGPITGPGPVGRDSQLIMAAPGEHMLTADEVAAAGGHDAIYRLRRALLTGALKGYSSGGAINAIRPMGSATGSLLRRVPTLPRIPASMHSSSARETVNVNFNLGELGKYPMQAAPDVASELAKVINKEARKRGRR